MKLLHFSDYHLEYFRKLDTLTVMGIPFHDIIVIGGDFCDITMFKEYEKEVIEHLKLLKKKCKKLFWIMGNHEYYGNKKNMVEVEEYLQKKLPFLTIVGLEPHLELFEDKAIVMSTLWTNFNNFNPLDVLRVRQGINDYSLIRENGEYLEPEHILGLYVNNTMTIEQYIREYPEKEFYIITHHSPSFKSTAEPFVNDPKTSAYSSNLENLMYDYGNIKYWLHGHLHHDTAYTINKTTIVGTKPKKYYSYDNGTQYYY